MSKRIIKVERDGWFIDIEPLSVSRRPGWEIRCLIRRERDGTAEERSHRFFVAEGEGERLALDDMADDRREQLLAQAAKRVILRELDEIFLEPAEGLDSLRPLTASELDAP